MTLNEFKTSLDASQPDNNLSEELKSLWWDAKGDWEQAHSIAQDIITANGSWIHAYLHRKEGDLGNAGYWYARAGKPVQRSSLESEWESLVSAFLK